MEKTTPKISKLPKESHNFGDTPHPFSESFHDEMGGFWGWLPGFLGLASWIFGVGFLDFCKIFPRFLDGLGDPRSL